MLRKHIMPSSVRIDGLRTLEDKVDVKNNGSGVVRPFFIVQSSEDAVWVRSAPRYLLRGSHESPSIFESCRGIFSFPGALRRRESPLPLARCNIARLVTLVKRFRLSAWVVLISEFQTFPRGKPAHHPHRDR